MIGRLTDLTSRLPAQGALDKVLEEMVILAIGRR
jgi:hypothetical protein